MTGTVLFYFDFLSPYGYLGSVGVESLAGRLGLRVDWRPVLLGISVTKVMGLKPIVETPLKGPYVRHDVPRLARYMGVPLKRAAGGPMRSLPAMRAFSWLKAEDPALAHTFARRLYRAQWGEGRDMSEPAAVAALAGELGVDPEATMAALADDAVKARLKEEVDAAIAAGVFGVPTFVYDGEMFWGADRLPMLERWIAEGGF